MNACGKFLVMMLVVSFGYAPADNLIRVVRWAQKLKVGIYFGGQ